MTGQTSGNGWRIDPDTVRTVLTATRNDLSGLDTAKAAVTKAIEGASAVVGPKTAAALALISGNPLLSQIAAVDSAVGKVIDQTQLALDAYTQGDDEMATNLSQGAGR
ncbi:MULTISPECIES: DUF6507 family protein [Clavibacter]|uniref:ESX-1 secretion-associated protein n=1 Tax=Clavibacter tessellarius TaxID=31965 RepID=A0A154V390_9MICO|nr:MULTISPECIES: DUF6507 family protein [Clavibacter]KZC95848.1 hypothetical protein AWH51_05875 [Clavibacter michiganensis subsp. tessellarius]MDA3806038.1 DUF6507 family protein [Clavibacter sp. CT19]